MQSDVTFIRAHRVSTPIVAAATPNANATLSAWCHALAKFRGEADITPSTPVVVWDCVQGVRLVEPADAHAKSAMQMAFKKAFDKPAGIYVDPVPVLTDAIRLPQRSVVFLYNLHRFFDTPAVIQAIANAYEPFKKTGKAAVMIGPGFRFPDEIGNDVYLIDEDFPGTDELQAIIQRMWKAFEASMARKGKQSKPLAAETSEKAIDALRGLSSSSAEQIFSMSITAEGDVDLELLWKRKIQYIESTRGLRVHRGGEKLDDLGGLENLKKMARRLAGAKRKIKAVVFMDEVDKSDVASASTDTSGTSIDALGTTLSYMEEHKAIGKVLLGPPGTGKSHIARAIGNECGVLIIEMDSGAMKSKWVGESQDMIRQAYKVVTAIAPSDVLFIATCLVEGTLVEGEGGELVPIETAARLLSPLASVRVGDGRRFLERPSHASVRTAGVFRLETSSTVLECTGDHRFYKIDTTSGEIVEARTDTLKPGDWLAQPRPDWPDIKRTRDDESYLAGYSAGDGNLHLKGRLQWSEEDDEQAMRISQICKKLFGKEASIHPRANQNSNLVYIDSVEATMFAANHGSSFLVGQEKRSIPHHIFQSRNAVVEFISGLFDADGSSSRDRVEIKLTSKVLVQQAAALLLRMGIKSVYGSYRPESPRLEVHSLTITGEHARLFHERVGFRMSRKRRVVSTSRRHGSRLPMMKKLFRSLGLKRLPRGPHQSISRKVLLASLGLRLQSPPYAWPVGSWLAFEWDRVKRVTNLHRKARVWDITMPTHHTFVAGSLVTHNCNRDSALPPEFRRRFTFGTWFLDLPNTDEKKLIWQIQMKVNGIESQELPDDTKWTGAEIRNCCATAARLEIPLVEAAGFVLPIAVSAAGQVESFRQSCAGKYISASYAGPYRGPEEDDEKMGPTRLMD